MECVIIFVSTDELNEVGKKNYTLQLYIYIYIYIWHDFGNTLLKIKEHKLHVVLNHIIIN